MRNRSIQQPSSERLPKARKTKNGAPPSDPTEIVLAELRLRRERLQQLLDMIHLEAGRAGAAHQPQHPRHKCMAASGNSRS